MTINFSETLAQDLYDLRLQAFIKAEEGEQFFPYVDGGGTPTIGWGFAINDKHAAFGVVDNIIKHVLKVTK